MIRGDEERSSVSIKKKDLPRFRKLSVHIDMRAPDLMEMLLDNYIETYKINFNEND